MNEHTILMILAMGILLCLGTSVYLVWRNLRGSLTTIYHLTNSAMDETRQDLAEVRARLEASLITAEKLRATLARLELLRQEAPSPSRPPEGTQR